MWCCIVILCVLQHCDGSDTEWQGFRLHAGPCVHVQVTHEHFMSTYSFAAPQVYPDKHCITGGGGGGEGGGEPSTC